MKLFLKIFYAGILMLAFYVFSANSQSTELSDNEAELISEMLSTAIVVSPESSTVPVTLGNDIFSTETTTEMAPTETTTKSVLQKWQAMEKSVKVLAKNGIKSLLGRLMEGSGNLNVSASCKRDALKLITGLRDIKTWAFSFIDSSAKIIDGMLGGTMSNLGEYDQCQNILATEDRRGKNFGKVMFTGQYCALDIRPPLPPKKEFYKLNEVVDELKNFSKGGNIINEAAKAAQFFHFIAIRYGICVPSGCSASDIQEVINSATKDMYWSVKVKRCELKQENVYTPLIICVMTAMCFFGFLMLVGSLIELYHMHEEKKIESSFLQILACFSLIANFKKLVNTESSSDKLSCLNGFRFLSISWIILAHTYLNINFILFRGLKRAEIIQQDFWFSAIVNASVAVDTFFFIGGLLVCYVTVKVIRETKKSFNIPVYILHRLFRFYPVYIMVILFMYLAPILGSGPTYRDTTDGFVDACYKNWWTNLLFINNFVNAEHMCLPQSWYISSDMQLYLVSILILVPLLKWPRVGLSLAFFGVIASMVGTGALTYFNNYPPTMLFVHPDPDQRNRFWAETYFKPYSHAGPYFIGMMVAYLLATKPNLKFSRGTKIIGWCCATACNLAVLYGVYDWNRGRDPEVLETIFYSSCQRVAWALGVAWVVVNCATGQGGIVNYILSWKCWIPLGRLTFTAYLIHPIVQISAVGGLRMNLQTQHFFAVWMYFGHLMITYGSAFATSMLVEAPFLSIEKILLAKLAGKGKDRPNDGAELERKQNGRETNGVRTQL